jgi:hypothetical protein
MRTVCLFLLMALAAVSCKKKDETECYDFALEQHFKKVNCTQDCPGVVGCDGKNYCNECVANQHGIKVEK